MFQFKPDFITPEMTELLRRSGHDNHAIALPAAAMLAKALTMPLRQGILNGDTVISSNIYTAIPFAPGQAVEFPLDFLSPGTEKDFIAYVVPKIGALPEKNISSDYVMVPIFDIGASIDWSKRWAEDARWDIMGRAMQVLEGMFVRKMNNDGWHTILAAGAGRNLVVYDNAATAGLFTKRLVTLMETVMRRNAGGNSTSINRGKLTDLWMSPEAKADVLSWDLTQVPDAIRTQIFLSGAMPKIGEVTLHTLDELGEGQEYETYYESTLSGSVPGSKTEICVGLDLVNRDSFVHPVRKPVEIFEMPQLFLQRRFGLGGFAAHGWSVLDSRRVLLGAL